MKCKSCNKNFKPIKFLRNNCSFKCRNSWHAIQKPNCKNCGKLVKRLYSNGTKKMEFCSVSCSKQEKFHPRYKGGIRIDKNGYRQILIQIGEKRKYFREHRIIIEKHIGRKLSRKEVIHHINGNKIDNRIENLKIMSQSEHKKLHNSMLRV